jgi:hypothetical protein
MSTMIDFSTKKIQGHKFHDMAGHKTLPRSGSPVYNQRFGEDFEKPRLELCGG